MRVTRDGVGFEVIDVEQTKSWQFWQLWAGRKWESKLLDIMDDVLGADGLFIDVGAWVGPMTLWAARLAERRVVALEPDPVAFGYLQSNVAANDHSNALLLPYAAANKDGTLTLHSLREEWGWSTSSLLFEGGYETEVRTLDIVSLVEYFLPYYAGRMLVKMDTEGGEALVFDRLGPVLREHRVPLLLSVHVGLEVLEPEWSQWDAVDLRAAGHSYYLTPK